MKSGFSLYPSCSSYASHRRAAPTVMQLSVFRFSGSAPDDVTGVLRLTAAWPAPRAAYHWRSTVACGMSGFSWKDVLSNPLSEWPPKSLTVAAYASRRAGTATLMAMTGWLTRRSSVTMALSPNSVKLIVCASHCPNAPTLLVLSMMVSCLRFISLPLRERKVVIGSYD